MRLTVAGVLATLLLAACAAQRLNGRLEDGYTELVQLQGAALTLLQDHRISRAEARSLMAELDRARTAIDQHHLTRAQVQLDAVRVYLKARQGQPL